MKIFEDAFGWLFYKMHIIYERYVVRKAIVGCAGFGKNSKLNYPCRLVGYNKYTKTKYIHIGNGVSIGANSTIFATRAHLYIGDRSFSGPNLTIMTGDHPFDIKGRYMADNRKVDIEKEGRDIAKYDQDIIIEDDVWMGCNVTILKGVRIGRGSIVSAGSVVTKSFPPYSIIGGVPAKFLKCRWESEDDIMEHEKLLYGYSKS